ncbi:MAG: small ribosomal subunit Rsm22 family protein [Kiritimatiellaeota bacterium]|nr:small ribosomal subunit Rsm22 family protein [Kiritimatiellota bacterium]
MKPAYPEALESWWTREAERVTRLRGPAALNALASEIGAMGARFTRERPDAFDDYTETPAACAAYGIYFFPQTHARTQHVLDMWQGAGLATTGKTLDILDVGSGTGAAGMAVAGRLACHSAKTRVTALDRSPLALETARRIFTDCKTLWPDAEYEGVECDVSRWEPAGRQWDIMVCGFVLNELGGADERLALAQRMLGGLKPGGVLLVLEPAGEEASVVVMELRDALATQGVRVLAPCPHQLSCPMRAAPVARRGYCHDVRSWRVPASLEFVNRTQRRTIWDVKTTYLVGVRNEELGVRSYNSSFLTPNSSLTFRLVSPVTRTKAHVVLRGCCADGTLRDFELQCRDATKAELRALDTWQRGDLATADVERLLGDGRTWRVKRLEKPLFSNPAPTGA